MIKKENNKFISYFIMLITFFILILVTKGIIVNIQENNDLKDSYKIELDSKTEQLEKINKKKIMLNKSSENIDKYNIVVKEDEIIDYLYSYIEETNRRNWITLIKNISISNPKKTEIWFNETDINLTLTIPNEKKLKTILLFLTSSKSKYNFFINSFNYPYGKNDWDFTVTLPLKLLYK